MGTEFNEIVIYGGAFDPMTNGHLEVIRAVERLVQYDEFWVMPCYNHVYGKTPAESSHRVEMLNRVIGKKSNIKISEYEIKNKLSGSMYETIISLRKNGYSQTRFSLVIGLDNANTIEGWKHYKELLELVRFIVFPRIGESPIPDVDWYMKEPHLFFQNCFIPKSASKDIRELIKNHRFEDAKKMMPIEAGNYIKEKGLYLCQV